jgi:hypothetical protein
MQHIRCRLRQQTGLDAVCFYIGLRLLEQGFTRSRIVCAADVLDDAPLLAFIEDDLNRYSTRRCTGGSNGEVAAHVENIALVRMLENRADTTY